MGALPYDIRTDFEHPLDEWVYWARELMDYKPDATFWDLFRLMYYIKVGTLIPEEEKNG